MADSPAPRPPRSGPAAGRPAAGHTTASPPGATRLWRFAPFALLLLAAFVGWLAWDWWSIVPAEVTAQYVGRDRCLVCHQSEAQKWNGSDHDRAMDHATAATVLGDFQDVSLEHHGAKARFSRRGDQFWVRTEGPDGQEHDYPIRFVFGVKPLQQYLVEIKSGGDAGGAGGSPSAATREAKGTITLPTSSVSRNAVSQSLGRLQVLRWSWDTERKRWFHLDPPDARGEKLAADDPLHWTGAAQNWNHMCADCHSTNVHKNFDLATRTYHTTFSEIDVSCETCHGPGSLHVQLASARSPFWDRERGYGLVTMQRHEAREEVESCAPCHSRRSVIHPGEAGDETYFDRHDLELLRPETYYADGQIRDEVYEFGSFRQSKMYHKGIRCSDCHDPHSTRVYFEDNRLCTSCHQHAPSKYDTPEHHHHAAGSAGSQCVACHMPETPFMDVDLRRDHGLRVPRPDLSVTIQSPNVCTGCHLGTDQVPGERLVDAATAAKMPHYADWLSARQNGQEAVGRELARVDAWSADWFARWYGPRDRATWPLALAAGWRGDPTAVPGLTAMVEDRELPGIVRASGLERLSQLSPADASRLASEVVRDADPLLRAAALRALEAQAPQDWRTTIVPRLGDPVRLVRTEAARMLASVPAAELSLEQQKARHRGLEEMRQGLEAQSDQAGALLMLGVLAEQQGMAAAAEASYRAAIAVQPQVTGPRSNLAALLERQGDATQVARLRAEELDLLARDARLAPRHAATQYRYALSLYLNGRVAEAVPVLQQACTLEPNNADFHLMLALLLEHNRRWDEALAALDQLERIRPADPGAAEVRARIEAQRKNQPTTAP